MFFPSSGTCVPQEGKDFFCVWVSRPIGPEWTAGEAGIVEYCGYGAFVLVVPVVPFVSGVLSL